MKVTGVDLNGAKNVAFGGENYLARRDFNVMKQEN